VSSFPYYAEPLLISRSSFTQEEIDAFAAIEAEIPRIRETLEGLLMVDVKYFIHLLREAS
jgi:hypothetical protein